MKIVIVTSCSFPVSEGLGTHIKTISENFTGYGHEVEVYIRQSGYGNINKIFENGVKYILIPSSSLPVVSSVVFRNKCEKLLESSIGSIDIIHYHSPLVLPLRIKPNVKVVTTVHSTMIEDTRYIETINLKSFLYKAMGRFISPLFERSLFKISSNIIAVSPGVKKELVSLYDIKEDAVETIINGIDLTIFKPTCSKRKDVIVYVGRVGFRKGICELIEAININRNVISNYKFIIIGSGDLDYYLERKINEYSLNDIIEWYKNVPQKELPDLISSSKFLIMPSSYETGPRVVLEALACLTPPIATPVGLVPQISENAYIKINSSNVTHISDAIEKAINILPEEYNDLVESCNFEKNKFDTTKSCKEIIKIYEG